ncbi:adenylate cyclase [Pararhizobium sp. BT-229]|uniref:tetratricopeptide repeat protein n=1 Tax=Pararhizobium sp. BT-229 TaxID=2986923 RepID=UPI0021F770EC|nr:tetratricopeptide repeat protein [Pararhizobium sp. BT-229]MCV9966890.1 adenylate cyclase [Pararhizobium sp. BT-229]
MLTSTDDEVRKPPCEEEIRAQLQRIVTSTEFPNVGRGAAFLSYIVEESLAGNANRIKGYSIALEVFKRDVSFTQDDPVVRIQAGRLRRVLERYYLTAGRTDPIRIDIPKGGYAPVFTWSAPPSPELDHEQTEPAHWATRYLPPNQEWWSPGWRTVSGIAAAAFILFGGAYWVSTLPSVAPATETTVIGPDVPTIVIAPFADLGEGPQAKLYTLGLTEELLTTLPRFKEIRVFGRETSNSLTPDADIRQVRDQVGARYLLSGGVRVSGDHMRVTARLVDTDNGAILWSQNYDNRLGSRDLFAIQADVAGQVATAVAQPYGIVAQADASRPPPDDLGAYECTLNFYAYRAELSPERHALVRDCLESSVARYPTYATAWAMLSIVYLDEGRFQFNPVAAAVSPLERALQTARQAVQVEPGNTRALQALMNALFFTRQPEEAIRVGERALAINPNDTELMGEFGALLNLAGQWQRGADLLDNAIALNPGGGGFYRGSRALASAMLGDHQRAVREIRQADLQKFPIFHLVAAMIFAEAGMEADARRAGELFVRMRPAFMPNVVEEMKQRNMRPDDQARFLAAMRKAGMPVPATAEPVPGATSEASEIGAP